MAIDLFIERGYEETTVDDICAVAGISRSSFFRYFHSKEDVLLREVAGAADDLLSALQARPGDETPWTAIRRALNPVLEQYGAESERSLRSARLVTETPSLARFSQEKLALKGRCSGPRSHGASARIRTTPLIPGPLR